MAAFKWTDKLNTGIKLIDGQHRELFRRIDELALALYEGQTRHQLTELIDFLHIYVKQHFNAEEEIMKSNSFPGLSEHRKNHESFTDIYNRIINDYMKSGSGPYIALRVEKEMRDWWENHIMKMDMEYVPYVKK